MTANVIDGKAFAMTIRARVTAAVAQIKSEGGATPGLAVILVGEDPASEVYVRSKHKATVAAGMNSYEHKLPADVDQQTVLDLIDQLNADETVHGILCQLPLPKHIDEDLVINAIAVEKDVDGFSIQNVGLLSTGQEALVPATPAGSILLLRDQLGDLSGMDAVVIGRSNIVGKPMAQLLLKDSATVTVAHSRTKNLQELVARADIVVAAVGRAEMVKADWIKPGATVIDVGINRIIVDGEKKLVGDVDYDEVIGVAGAVTPVPGGVGPMTIAMLLANTLTAFCRVNNIPVPEGLSV